MTLDKVIEKRDASSEIKETQKGARRQTLSASPPTSLVRSSEWPAPVALFNSYY